MSEIKIKHKFEIGKELLSKEVKNPEEYLETALATEKYLESNRIDGPKGTYWRIDGIHDKGTDTDITFYSGTAGVVYFYLKLYETTKNETYLDTVKDGATYLLNNLENYIAFPPAPLLPGSNDGLYFGLGGIGLVLKEIFKVVNDDNILAGIKFVTNHYLEAAKQDEDGTYWTGFVGIAMDGGIILTLLSLYEVNPSDRLKETILSAGARYLSKGEAKEDGGLEYNGFKGIAPFSLPNFEFGSAGAGYLLTLLYDFTGEDKYLEGAKQTAVYLRSISVPQSKGYLIPHHIYSDDEPVFYLSTCHGPAGTAKLFYNLYLRTKDETYLKDISDLVDGLESLGAPEKMSAGLWNNVCFCCGQAGLLQFFIGLYLGLKDDRYLDLARRTAAVLIGEKEDRGSFVNWDIAWERVKPENISHTLGYYDGSTGVAAVLLQIYLLEKGDFSWSRLPDDPFPEKE